MTGPALNGYQSDPAAPLTVAYSLNVDTRWVDVVLSPLTTAIDCSAAGGTPASINCGAFSEGMSHGTGAEKLVLGRGTKPAIIDLATQLNVADGTYAGWASAATDMIYTKSAAGTEEISVALASDIYRVITVVPNTGSFTDSANDESNKFRVFGRGASTSTSVGVVYGAGVGTTSVENLIRSNAISGTVTMDASAWATRATVSGEPITFTGFVPIGDQFIVLTSNGPYLLNDIYQRYEPLMPELDNDANNGKGAFSWSVAGAFVPSTTGLRMFRDAYTSATVGPEVFPTNSTSINGRVTAGWASARWAYIAINDPISTNTWICAIRPREAGDWHSNPISFFPLFRNPAGVSLFGTYAGKKGSQTQPTHYVAYGTDIVWWADGLSDQRPDDSNVTYASSGNVYGTQLRLTTPAHLKSMGFTSKNCSTTNYLTPSIAYVDSQGVAQSVTLPPITTNGWNQFDLEHDHIRAGDTAGRGDGVRWFNPTFQLNRGATTTATPKLANGGEVVLTWD